MQKTYIIPDPHELYAQKLMDIIEREHGLQAVCVYTTHSQELAHQASLSRLQSRRMLATYALDRQSLAEIAAAIRRDFEPLAVVPFFELSLVPMTELARLLGLSWNDPDVLGLFRDKAALKEHVAQTRPDLPLGTMRRVHSAEGVLAAPLPASYVVKPVDGFGNRGVGFFGTGTSRAELEAFFAASDAGTRYILEELFVGDEYAVNGQMDHHGEMTLINITRYERRAANGRPNVYFRTHHVKRQEKGFQALSDYARAVIQATDLRRCPFHMELMLTPSGPRLIEVGARFGGTFYALMSQAVHGPQFNFFQLAAHYYLHNFDFGPIALDWEHYDRIDYVHQDAISHVDGHIYRLRGRRTIEAMRGFRGWVVTPRLGDRLQVTRDIYTVPYSFHMSGFHGAQRLAEDCDRALSLLRISPRPSALARLAGLPMRGLGRAHRLLKRLVPAA